MARTLLPTAIDAGARVVADCRVARLVRSGSRIVGARCDQTLPDGTSRPLLVRRPRVRVRGRDPDARVAATQRHPLEHRPGLEDAPDGQDRGALRFADRSRRRTHAPGHRVLARAHDRRVGESPRSCRARARRLRRRLRRRARPLGQRRRVLRRDPQRGLGPGDRATGLALAARHVPTHRRRHEPARPRARASR